MAAAVDVELAQVRKKMLSISTVVNASSIIGRGSLIGVQLIDNLSKASNQQVFVDTDTAANTARVQEAADALLDSCILDISSVLKQKEQHYQQVEAQEPHAHGKSASSMPDKGGVNKEDERWRYQVIAPDMVCTYHSSVRCYIAYPAALGLKDATSWHLIGNAHQLLGIVYMCSTAC